VFVDEVDELLKYMLNPYPMSALLTDANIRELLEMIVFN
jgi:hypothetical protein